MGRFKNTVLLLGRKNSGTRNWGLKYIATPPGETIKEQLDAWAEFCKDNKWDADKAEIVDAWITYPDIDDLIDEDWEEYDDGKMTVEERNRCSRP